MDIFEKKDNPIVVSQSFSNEARPDERFLVVTNMRYQEDRLTGQVKNIYRGLSETDFKASVLESGMDHDLDILYMNDGVVVLEGTEKSFSKVREECGDGFSYAVCDRMEAERVIDVYEETSNETTEDYDLRRRQNVIMQVVDLH